MKLWLDTETFSPTPLKRGVYRYAADPAAEVMIVTWAADNGPVMIWDRVCEALAPQTLIDAMRNCDEVWAQNANFDRQLLKTTELPQISVHKWRCMMTRAYMHGLPGKLEKLSEIFKLGLEAKADGTDYIRLFCAPAKGKRNTVLTHPQEWGEFCEYAKQDIVAMRALDMKIPRWNSTPEQWQLYTLDQERNDRGFAVDVELAERAIEIVTREQKRLAERTQELTDDEVLKPTQRDKLLVWILAEHGVALPDLKADTLQRRIEDPELPETVKELLRIRLRASKASVSKYRRVVECEVRGRLRGTVQHCGAQRTGRDAGRIFQPQNLARLDVNAVAAYYGCKPSEDQIDEYLDIALETFKSDCADLIFGDGVMQAASNLLRGVIVAAPDKKLVVADLANIEGRGLAWLAGEAWKLKAFREYDAGTGHDLYVVAYGNAFRVPFENVDKFMRQIGKVMELALGYQGGVGAFATMAATYGMDLEDLAERAWHVIPPDIMRSSLRKRDAALDDPKRRKLVENVSERVWLVCQSLVTMWRNAHPETTQFWWDVENAAKSAVASPGMEFIAGPGHGLRFDRLGNWLRMKLPSGRYLCYPSPQLKEDAQGRTSLSYVGVDPYTRQWRRINTYAGKLVENAVQAISRDVLKHGEVLCSQSGFDVVLPVHDELVTEMPNDPECSEALLSSLMSAAPAWAEGLPLSAKGFEATRYRKG